MGTPKKEDVIWYEHFCFALIAVDLNQKGFICTSSMASSHGVTHDRHLMMLLYIGNRFLIHFSFIFNSSYRAISRELPYILTIKFNETWFFYHQDEPSRTF